MNDLNLPKTKEEIIQHLKDWHERLTVVNTYLVPMNKDDPEAMQTLESTREGMKEIIVLLSAELMKML